LQADTLSNIAKEYLLAEAVIDRLTRVIDPGVLHALLVSPDISLVDEAAARETARRLTTVLGGGVDIVVDVERDPRTDGWRLLITRTVHGNNHHTRIDHDFVESGDYTQIKQTAQVLQGLIQPGAYVRRGEQRAPVGSFKQALEWLLDHVRRNIAIQRYKGLGEMNPEQLWDTTMNPQTRRLLRVQVEDLITSDEIFTTLMGDEVEPRRQFIENNALGVRNLDV